MNSIIIICILTLIIIGLLLFLLTRPRPSISHFGVIQGNKLEYSNINDAYDKPYILSRFLTAEQCSKIMKESENNLVDSEVIGGKHKNIRNSKQTWISRDNPLVKSMISKITRLYGIPAENAEDLQVVRYLPNQYYNEHHDSCCDDNEKCREFITKGGQRILTVLIYLNNEFDDGNTYFKNLDLKFKPPVGDAIVFCPLAKGTSKCHPLALHAGMPVTKGVKWVANLWFRERKFK